MRARAALALAGLALAGAQGAAASTAAASSGLLVTFAARECSKYTDVTANRARNDIQESLRNLGADTPYSGGQPIDAATEAAYQPACRPLPGWTFTLGTGYRTRAVSGPWGSLSIVTGAFSTPIATQASTALLDPQGRPTGQSIAGAVTVELSEQQAQLASRPSSLWAQGGTTADPILNQVYPSAYGFAALRCALDNLNGDNVEWIGFPSGSRHVFCFAYYVTPPPTSGTIVIRKVAAGPPGMAETFPFEGNLSFNAGGRFTLAAQPGSPAQQTFIRAQTHPGEAPWAVRETPPPNWRLAGLGCTSQTGASVTATDLPAASVAVGLAAEDTVTCTYTDEFVPPHGGLLIRKLTHGGAGRFGFRVEPAAGGAAVTAEAVTEREDLAVDALPSPLDLAPGRYTISESEPAAKGGRWELSGAECDGHDLPLAGPLAVTVPSGGSATCTFTNTFIPSGSITLAKTTLGGLARTGFVISPLSGPPFERHQSASTTREGVPARATGEAATGLALGGYLIQETTPEPAGGGHWDLTSVSCNGRLLPFAEGQVKVELTAARHAQGCIFTNTRRPGPDPVTPPLPEAQETAALSVTKRALRPAIALGEAVAFEISVHNSGPSPARDLTVDDEPGGSPRILAAETGQGRCSLSPETTCLVGTLAAGHTAHVILTLQPLRGGTLSNCAVAGTSTPDPSYARDAACASVAVASGSSLPAFTG